MPLIAGAASHIKNQSVLQDGAMDGNYIRGNRIVTPPPTTTSLELERFYLGLEQAPLLVSLSLVLIVRLISLLYDTQLHEEKHT